MQTQIVEKKGGSDVRDLLSRLEAAVIAKDSEGLLRCYARDVVAFDAVSQLQYRGVDEYRAAWESGFEMSPGPMIFEPREMEMRVSGDLAVCHGMILCGGTGEDGSQQSCWFRATLSLERRDGTWVIAHEHYSVPFDMESGSGLFALAPD